MSGRRVRDALLTGLLMLAAAACGGSGNPNNPTVTDVSAGNAVLPAGDFLVVSFSLDSRSALRAQINWSLDANDLDAFLIRGTCSRDDVLNATPACTMDAAFVGSGTGTARPEIFSTASLDAGPYTLVVVNRGSRDDTCNYRVSKTG